MALRFKGHHPVIVAVDGQPCDQHPRPGGRQILGPAMRIDVMLDMTGEPARRYRVVDDFYDGLAYWLTQLAYDEAPSVRAHSRDTPPALPRNPVPEPELWHPMHFHGHSFRVLRHNKSGAAPPSKKVTHAVGCRHRIDDFARSCSPIKPAHGCFLTFGSWGPRDRV
jgi:FtsP/CotA-like multicopper oxidase with cupredoxin domain